MKYLVRLAGIFTAFGATPVAAGQIAIDRSLYPKWIVNPSVVLDETVTLQSRSYVTLFTVRPLEAFALLDPVMAKKGKEVLPSGAQMIRAPGPEFVACEAVRKPGNERFTCLRDDNRDGIFDQFMRLPTASNYFIYPIQGYPLTYKPLFQPVRYRDLDEVKEFRPVEFILRFSHIKDWGLIDFCFEPFRRKASWGFPHLVDACLVQTLRPRYADLPKSRSLHGFQVSALAFDPATKSMKVQIRRQAGEYQVTFGYSDKEAE